MRGAKKLTRKLESLLNSEVNGKTKSQRTATEYLNVARKLFNGDYTDKNIPSKARFLQISAVISYLKDYELIPEHENFGLHMRALKKRYKGTKDERQQAKTIEKKVLTDSQFHEFLTALPNTHEGHELKLACEISRYSGLRMSEVLSLTPANIEVNDDAIYLDVIEGKRGKDRTAYLPLDFAPVFKTFAGFTISRNYVACTFHRIAKKIGLTSSFHSLRHTFATEQTENGMDIRTLAGILGHSDPKTTMIYSHVKRDCPQQLLEMWKKTR